MKRDYYSGFFFQSTRTDQKFLKVLQNIIAPNCTIWSSELNQKGFSCFPAYHTIPGETKGSPLPIFFGTARLFFRKFFPQRVPPSIFCCFATEWMLENPKGSPLSVFFGTEIFSENKNFSFFNFLMFCDKTPSTATKMLTISEVSPFQRARGSR